MTDKFLKDLNLIASLQSTDLFYVARTGSPDRDYRATGTQLQTFVEANLSTVAASGLYSDLSGIPTLGTLSSQNFNNVSITGGTITGLSTPTAGSDVAIKSYVDNATVGLKEKGACDVATTATLTANYYNGVGNDGIGATLTNSGTLAALSIDTVSLVSTNIVLVKDQATPAHNGIYVVTNAGSGAVAWILTRVANFNQTSNISAGSYVVIVKGSPTNKGTLWVETGSGPFTPGTTDIIFTSLSVGSQTITFIGDVAGTGSGTISLTIASSSVSNAKLAQMPAHTYKGNNTGSTAGVLNLTNAQLTADMTLFSNIDQGVVPASGGGSVNFLRADGTWAIPTASGVNLSNGVFGNLPIANLNGGTSASSATFWRGDGQWASPAGGGNVNGPVSSSNSAIVLWNGTSGTVIKDSGVNIDIDGTLASNTDFNVPTQKAVKTYADTKVSANGAITGATHTKITYDSKGLVTSATDATTADVADSLNKRYVTDAELTVLGNTSGVNTGDSASIPIGYLTTDGTLAANSDVLVPSQKAVKTYADNLLASNNAFIFKGVIDASANPNYPASSIGWTWKISVAGKIGGASGLNVNIGDTIYCTIANAGGTQAAVGADFVIIAQDEAGEVIGPVSAVDSHVVFFDGITGKLIKDSGLTLSGSNTGDQTISDVTITTTDITTNNVSITKHGFAPKAPNDATKYLDGTGAYSIPSGSGATNINGLTDAIADYSTKHCVFLGNVSGASNTGTNNTSVGDGSLNAVTGGGNNTGIGRNALLTNAGGSNNTACGNAAISLGASSSNNSGFGMQALYSATGDNNTGVGVNAGYLIVGGSGNTALGKSSGATITTGTNNVVLGFNSDVTGSAASNQIAIGYGATAPGDNKAQIGNASITDVYFGNNTAILHGNGSLLTNLPSSSNVTTTSTSTNASFYPLFVASSSNGSQVVNLAASGFIFNPSTGLLTVTTFSGATATQTARDSSTKLASTAYVDNADSAIPQNSQSAAYTTVLSDAGKHIFHPSADTTARTFTIDSNTNVPYVIGTAITFINQHDAGVVTIAITTDAMYLAGAGTTGSRTLAANGMATAVKVTSTEWIISGSGLT